MVYRLLLFQHPVLLAVTARRSVRCALRAIGAAICDPYVSFQFHRTAQKRVTNRWIGFQTRQLSALLSSPFQLHKRGVFGGQSFSLPLLSNFVRRKTAL